MIGGRSSLSPIGINQLQAGRILESPSASIPHLFRASAEVELAQRVTAIPPPEIVFGPEQALPSGLALARASWRPNVSSRRAMVLRERFSAFTSGRDGGGTAAAASGWSGRSPFDLKSCFRPSSRAEQIVDPHARFHADSWHGNSPVPARVGKHEDPLDVIHEGRALGEVFRVCGGVALGGTQPKPRPLVGFASSPACGCFPRLRTRQTSAEATLD